MIEIKPTRKYVVIATYDNDYALTEVFETNSSLRAGLVAKAIAEYWRRDLAMFGVNTQSFWTVQVEEPLYNHREGFHWIATVSDSKGNLSNLRPSHSIRRWTDDQDLAMEVD